ncbi:MAG: phage holin family protein [Pirellulaceae bacterium]|nr:phage holin family protein [Pirellulaceae bacterium]
MVDQTSRVNNGWGAAGAGTNSTDPKARGFAESSAQLDQQANSAANAAYRSSVGPIQGVTHGAGSVLGDALDLAELQFRLFGADASSCGKAVRAPIVGLVGTLGLLVSALPVLAFGLAELLHWSLNWPLWTCQLLVGGVFVVLGGLLGIWCVQRLRGALTAFSATTQEASANLNWLRQALRRSFTSPH